MFNFHKPRTYRSTEGCCICKAKSSSSRFTDSRKYEKDTMQCFDLKYPRQGEICNACVLLVKRFKRLPVGSKRNWSHIVDAKAGSGSGYNKVQTKYKSERINSRAAAQQQQNNLSFSSAASGNNAVNVAAAISPNGMSNYMPEKFSKIYKKTKKLKDSSSVSHSNKRKSSSNGWTQNNTHSLPIVNDSLDSDYEDTKLLTSVNVAPGSNSSVVEFQTQTRASAYKAQAAAEARKRIIKMGTKRRKCLPPRKYRRSMTHEESVKFFDKEEWQERKTCCGVLYECEALSGALLVDIDSYKPCEQHQKARFANAKETATAPNVTNSDSNKISSSQPLQKTIIQTIPAVVQLQPLQGPPLSSASSVSTQSNTTVNNNSNTFKTTTTTTPVLKKHHLFFKRQSECFPQGDMVTNNHDGTVSAAAGPHVNISKTEPEFNVPQQQNHYNQHQQCTTTANLQRHNENSINFSYNGTTTLTNPLMSSTSTSALSISVTSASSTTSLASNALSTMPQMPKHSLAKVTTISPPSTPSVQSKYDQQHIQHSSNNNSHSTSLPLTRPNGFMNKSKADTCRIVKHSLEKLNTAVRLKNSDLNEMKPFMRNVDRSYILTKPPIQANIISLNTNANNTSSTNNYQSLTTAQPPLTTTSLSVASPTSSTSSTSSTKFSDNSSDSGFDENMLDRKSASPLQEDCEKKILSRPGVQTMFLASGVQVHAQPQNLVLTGNEVAAKILQNRKYSSVTASPITTNPRSLTTTNHHQPTTTAVKITQISTTPLTSSTPSSSLSSSMSSAAQAKMRAIYNNNNTIQHENGITTIVPASSLAATTQTAAMQNIAPSSVTITPAPPLGAQFNAQNVISRKLTTNIINFQSNTAATNLSNSHYTTSGNNLHHHHQQHQHQHHLNSHHNNATTNQKIILLKTSPNNTTTLTSNYSNVAGRAGGGGQQHCSGGGR